MYDTNLFKNDMFVTIEEDLIFGAKYSIQEWAKSNLWKTAFKNFK